MRHLNFTNSATVNLSKFPLTYKIANASYQSNNDIPELAHLIESQTNRVGSPPSLQKNCPIQIYFDTCVIGNHKYRLTVSSNNNGCYHLKNEQNSYFINNNQIFSNAKTFELTLFTGPVLILNLALNKTFCLHASAFTLNNKTFILMADSGTGKSTIADFINKNTLGSRIADDIVPLDVNNGKIRVLVDFPQLKLPVKQQYRGKPIQNSVILLFAKKSLKSTKINKVNCFTALKKLIQHSVATKLFATNELQNHLDFCFELSHKSQAFQVEYSHTENSLSDLFDAINAII